MSKIVKKNLSMNIGKIKQKLVDSRTINMFAIMSSLKYLECFVVTYVCCI